MKTIELVAKIKANYPTMPDKKEFKKFIWKNNYDVDASSNEIEKILKAAYNFEDTSTGYEKQLKVLMSLGCTHKEMMDKLGMSSYEISELKNKYGLSKRRPPKDGLKLDSCYLIYEHYKKSGSYSQTAKKFKVDPKTVKSRVKMIQELKGEM